MKRTLKQFPEKTFLISKIASAAKRVVYENQVTGEMNESQSEDVSHSNDKESSRE